MLAAESRRVLKSSAYISVFQECCIFADRICELKTIDMKKIILLTLSVVIPFMAMAQKQRAKAVCGPYVQCVTETGFTVVWTTDVESVAWVEVAPDDGTHFYNKERDKYYDARGNGVYPISI